MGRRNSLRRQEMGCRESCKTSISSMDFANFYSFYLGSPLVADGCTSCAAKQQYTYSRSCSRYMYLPVIPSLWYTMWPCHKSALLPRADSKPLDAHSLVDCDTMGTVHNSTASCRYLSPCGP